MLDTYDLSALRHDDIENLNRPMTKIEIELVIQILTTKKIFKKAERESSQTLMQSAAPEFQNQKTGTTKKENYRIIS